MPLHCFRKFLLGPLLVCAVSGAAAPVLVDGIAATYGSSVLTVQDAYFYRAVLRFAANDANTSIEQATELRRTVQRLLFEAIVAVETSELPDIADARANASKKIDIARRAPGGDARWKRILSLYRRDDAEGRSYLARHEAVEKFLQKKLETLTPQVTESEIDRYVEVLKGNGRAAETRDRARRALRQERMQRGFEEWARSLRDKYRATNLLGGTAAP